MLKRMPAVVFEITISSVNRSAEAGGVYTLTNILAFDDAFLCVVADGVIFKIFATDRKPEVIGAKQVQKTESTFCYK